MGEGGQKVQTSIDKISPGDVMYTMVTIVNNIILYIWKLLREYIDLKSSHHEKKKVVTNVWWWLDLLWRSFRRVYKYGIIMLYTWNEYNVICQLCLNFLKKWISGHRERMTSSDTGQCPSSYFILENSNSLANAFTKTNLGYVNITITGN